MKNPIFYKNSNANAFKKSFEWRKIILGSAIMLFVFAFSAMSAPKGQTAKVIAGVSMCFLTPFAATVKGTKAVNGTDESDADFTARKGEAETAGAFVNRCVATLKAEIEEAKKNKDTELEAKLTELKGEIEKSKGTDAETFKKLEDVVKAQGLIIEGLKETAKVISERGIAKGSIGETLAKHREKIASFKKGNQGTNLEIEHKSNTSQTSTDIGSRGDTYFQMHEGGRIGQLPVRKPFLRNLFKNQGASSEYIKYMDQATAVRGAANVALCAASNSTSALTWAPQSIQITKIRDYIYVCKDMMDDYAFVEGEIKNLMDSSVALKIDDQLLVGTGTHPETNSLTSISSTWNATIAGIKDFANSVVTPTVVDLLAIAGAQIRLLGQNNAWMPNAILMNPGDLQLIKHLKNTLGDAVKFYPGFFIDAGGNCYIDGMLIVDNPNVTANTAWIGDFTRGTVYARPGIGIEMSYENGTNFEKEIVTVKAYERLNLLVRNVDANAFMTIADLTAGVNAIKTA